MVLGLLLHLLLLLDTLQAMHQAMVLVIFPVLCLAMHLVLVISIGSPIINIRIQLRMHTTIQTDM
jgi:hypothetical protein